MQFRITTMMMVMGTLALPMTLSAPAGPWMQAAALALAVLAWLQDQVHLPLL